MFGTTSSPGIYDRFVGLFLFLCVRKTKGLSMQDAARYLEDVIAVGPNKSQGLRNLYGQYQLTEDQIRVRLDESGNKAKCQPPDTTVVALGVHFDTQTWTWRMNNKKEIRLLHKIKGVLEGIEPDIKQNERIVGQIYDMSLLLEFSKHRLGLIFDFAEGSTSHMVKETLVWWMAKIKQVMKGYPIPKLGPHMSGNMIHAWIDAAG